MKDKEKESSQLNIVQRVVIVLLLGIILYVVWLAVRPEERFAFGAERTYGAEMTEHKKSLVSDVLAESDFFAVFLYHLEYFGIKDSSVLIGLNREMITQGDKKLIGLLLLMPTGILDTYMFEKESTVLFMQKGYAMKKQQREEWGRHGITVAEIRQVLKEHGIEPRPVKAKGNTVEQGEQEKQSPKQKQPAQKTVKAPVREVKRKGN